MTTQAEKTSLPKTVVVSSYHKALPRAVLDEIRAIGHHRELLRYMTSTALQITYSGTFFGYLWWLLDPFLQMGVYFVLVDVIMKRGGQDPALFIFISVLAWKYFNSGVRNAIGFTQSKGGLMRQVAFPHSLLPLSADIAETFRFGIGLLVILAFSVPFGIYPSWVTLMVLPVVAVQLLFTLGLAYLLSALNVLFRDIYNLTQYVFQLWFYMSPALYTLSSVPGRLRSMMLLNPFATLFDDYHKILMNHQMPSLAGLAYVGIGSFLTLVVGFTAFVRLQPLFVKVQ
jgi:lipopolysaccharide transport system permease protein/teichoic acid transport system permease protein